MRTALVAAGLLLAGCSSGSARPATLALPSGALVAYVPQPGQVPAGMVPVAAQTGPADVARLVTFGADAQRLADDGFQDAYVAEYADPAKGTQIVTTVVRFATPQGATRDLTTDLAAPGPGTRPVTAEPVGQQSAATVQQLPGGSATSQLVSVRFRQGRFTFLVAVGAPGKVDPASVTAIAKQLAGRVPA